MPAPPTDAPLLIRIVAVAPGLALGAVATAIEVGWLRAWPGHWLLGRPGRLATAAMLLMILGFLAPYLIYGIRGS